MPYVEAMTRGEYQELVEFLSKKFDAIDQRFDAQDQRFDAIDGRLDAHDQRLDAHDQRFDGIEGRLARVEVGLEENRHQTQILAEGLTSLRSEMGREFVAVRKEMLECFDAQARAIGHIPLTGVKGVSPWFRPFAAWGAAAVNAHRYYKTGKDH